MQTPGKKASHTIAIQNFDGETEIVEADELRFCLPNKTCIQFWAMMISCFLMIVIGIAFMTIWGPLSPYFFIGEAMMSTSLGILIPSPNYKKVFSAKKSERLQPEPIFQDENKAGSGLPLTAMETLG